MHFKHRAHFKSLPPCEFYMGGRKSHAWFDEASGLPSYEMADTDKGGCGEEMVAIVKRSELNINEDHIQNPYLLTIQFELIPVHSARKSNPKVILTTLPNEV